MDKEDELFELVDADDNIIGTAFRGVVHRQGLLHRAAYCWVFNHEKQVLLQRRSPRKKIGGGLWDLSLAEHLSPGESYEQAVVRGLAEELGIAANLADITGPLQPTHRRDMQQGEFHDAELVRSYRLDGYKGCIAFDDGEVVEARWVQPQQLRAAVEAAPEEYTRWMREEGAALGWFAGGGGADGAQPGAVQTTLQSAQQGPETST